MINALRPLEWLLLGVAGLLGLLMVGILSSIGDAPQLAAGAQPDARATAAAKVLVAPNATLESLAGTWQ
ncbi:general secretion pathway protein GspN, partial [Pseudomonas sp. MAFF 311095]|nr:general secretion pathway protein GspN [Pseudomonas petroselini]